MSISRAPLVARVARRRLVALAAAMALSALAACGSHRNAGRHPSSGSEGGPLLASGDGAATPTTSCSESELVLTGTLDSTRTSIRAATSGGSLTDGVGADAATKTAAQPGLLRATLANGAGDLRLEFDVPLALGRETAVRAQLRIKDGASLAVGNCAGSSAASSLWLTRHDGNVVEGKFVLQRLADLANVDCAGTEKAGTLVGCFAF